MSEHVTEWLGTYLDGELRGLRRQQVENHLERCAACRAELGRLRRLQDLLHAGPQASLQSVDKFVARLVLQLPRRPERGARVNPFPIRWWLVPAGIAAAWVSLQVLFDLAGIGSTLHGGPAVPAVAWLQLPSQTLWYSASMGLFGSRLGTGSQALLGLLNQAELFLERFAIALAWQAALAAIYWAWLALGWKRYRILAISSGQSKETGE